jgi:hypothetical protein
MILTQNAQFATKTIWKPMISLRCLVMKGISFTLLASRIGLKAKTAALYAESQFLNKLLKNRNKKCFKIKPEVNCQIRI